VKIALVCAMWLCLMQNQPILPLIKTVELHAVIYNYLCGIHNELRKKGFRGCSAYECFGAAGQKVSQITYNGKDWQLNKEIAQEMFDLYPIMQQLDEMLWNLLTGSIFLTQAQVMRLRGVNILNFRSH
jgi:hypothetical protein